MNNLITHTEFSELKSISKRYDDDKVNKSITQAMTDLREVLGVSFYFDVISNTETAEYTTLLDGGEFSVEGLTYVHDGLKSLVADYAYARYLYEVNTNLTSFGMVGKNNQDSTPVDRNMIKDLVGQTNKDAGRKWELIEDYLEANIELFPVWAKSKRTVDNNPASFNTGRFTFMSTGKN